MKNKRTTIYFDPELHHALTVQSAETKQSISYLVNEAVKASLEDDLEDLAAIKDRTSEPDLDFESVVKTLKKKRKL